MVTAAARTDQYVHVAIVVVIAPSTAPALVVIVQAQCGCYVGKDPGAIVEQKQVRWIAAAFGYEKVHGTIVIDGRSGGIVSPRAVEKLRPANYTD